MTNKSSLQEDLKITLIETTGNIVLIDNEIYKELLELQPAGKMTHHFLLRSYSHRVNPSLDEIPNNTYASVELNNWAVKNHNCRQYITETASGKCCIVITNKKDNWKRLKELGFERKK